MPIRIRCPACNAKLSVASRKAGQTIKCPGCKSPIPVPAADAPPEEAIPVAVVSPPQPQWPDEEPEDDDESFSVRKPDTDFEEMDLTPMVDVTFLLLIFFMITASFSIVKVLQFPPPDPEKEGVSQNVQQIEDLQKNSIIVEVDENNQITVDGDPISDRSKLIGALRERTSQEKNGVVLVLNYYAANEMKVVVKDAATSAQIQQFRFGIKPGTGPAK